jgi:hypothetical protein
VRGYFFELYQPLTTTWRMYDNSTHEPRLIASGAGTQTLTLNEAGLWRRIQTEAGVFADGRRIDAALRSAVREAMSPSLSGETVGRC